MAGSKMMLQDFEKYPKYKQAYLKAFEKMIENHPGSIRILDERVDMDDLGAGGYSVGGSGSATAEHRDGQPCRRLSDAEYILDWWIRMHSRQGIKRNDRRKELC